MTATSLSYHYRTCILGISFILPHCLFGIQTMSWQYNIFTRTAGRACSHSFRVSRKGVLLMSTYEELMVILTTGLLITAILNLKNK